MMDSAPNKKISIELQLYLILVLFTCFTFFQQTISVDAADHFQMDFGITIQKFAFAASLFFIPYALMQLPGGILLDKFGIQYVLPLSLILTTLGVAVFWWSSSEGIIGLGRIITGLGCSVAYISGIFVSVSFFDKARLPLLICFLECAASLGGLISALPLKVLINHLGWDAVGILNLVLCLILFIWSYSILKKIEIKKSSVDLSLKQLGQGVLCVLTNKKMLFIFGYSFCTWFVLMSFPGYWFKDYLKTVHQFSEARSLSLVEIYWGSFLMSCLLVGFFTHSFHRARKILLFLSSLAFLTYVIMAQPYLFNYKGLALFSIFGGISASGIIIAFSLIPWIIDSSFQGTAVAMNNTFVVLGGFFGQTLFGVVEHYFDINKYTNILKDSGIESHHYSALLIYLVFTFLALMFVIQICRIKISTES